MSRIVYNGSNSEYIGEGAITTYDSFIPINNRFAIHIEKKNDNDKKLGKNTIKFTDMNNKLYYKPIKDIITNKYVYVTNPSELKNNFANPQQYEQFCNKNDKVVIHICDSTAENKDKLEVNFKWNGIEGHCLEIYDFLDWLHKEPAYISNPSALKDYFDFLNYRDKCIVDKRMLRQFRSGKGKSKYWMPDVEMYAEDCAFVSYFLSPQLERKMACGVLHIKIGKEAYRFTLETDDTYYVGKCSCLYTIERLCILSKETNIGARITSEETGYTKLYLTEVDKDEYNRCTNLLK